MPYYVRKHILFIHIPKTGGTSVENALKIRDKQTMYSKRFNRTMPQGPLRRISLQHQTLHNIIKYRRRLPVRFNKRLRIITVVRNPYKRLVSDLFWYNLINNQTRPETVFEVIKRYVRANIYDNHNIPQHKFLVDGKGHMYRRIIVMKTERLTEQMKRMFNINLIHNSNVQGGKKVKKDYMSFLNEDSIKFINNFYKRDFELFGYKFLSNKN
jgi:hypothetical protein